MIRRPPRSTRTDTLFPYTTRFRSEMAKMPRVEGSGAGQIYMAPETARLFEQAQDVAKKAGDSFVTVERLLQAIGLASGTSAAKALAQAGVTPQKLNGEIEQHRTGRTDDSASAQQGYASRQKNVHALHQYVRDANHDPVHYNRRV